MTRRMGIALGVGAMAFWFMLALAGALLVWYAGGLPEYTDPDRARSLISGDCLSRAPSEDRRDCTAQWFKDMDALRTAKWTAYDSGRGLIALSLTALGYMALKRLWDLRRIADLSTPRFRLTFFVLGSAIWLAQIPVFRFRLMEEASRNYFPWWADSLGIGFAMHTTAVEFGLPVLLVVGLVALFRARVPVSLWLFDRARRIRNIVWTIVYGGVALVLLLASVSEVIYGSFAMVPILLIGAYLAVATRAAVLSGDRRMKA
jgi:hypothetical protein